MQIRISEFLAHDPERVWRVLYDRFEDMPEQVPNVLEILELSRENLTEAHELTLHRWTADPKLIPGFARPFIKPEVIQWTGKADWHHDRRTVHFDFQSHVFKNLYTCTGEFVVAPAQGREGSTIDIDAELVIYPDRLPGIPLWLGRKAAGWIEKIIGGAVRPSLAALPAAVETFAAAKSLL